MPEPSKGVGPTDIENQLAGQAGRKNYLLAIAIDKYEHLPRLYNAVRDAEAFAALLQEKYQFDPQHTTLLRDQEATRRNIYQSLDRLVQTVTPQDNLVLYFSGHGEFREQMDEGYWIPVDADRDAYFDFIPNQQIQHYLKRINSHHSFVVVDSCFSGALFTNRNLEPTERLETVPSRWLLTSGRKELVSDGKPGDHSPFAENVLFFLKQNQQPSLPISRLIDDVVHATAANARQTPRGEPIQDTGHKGGQFVFHLKRNQEAAWQAALAANSVKGYMDFEKEFPQSQYAREVRSKIAHLEEDKLWEKALRSDTITAYRDYLDRSPLKKYDSEATEAIERLSEPEEDVRRREAEARETRRRKEAEERARREADQRKKKEEKPPVEPFDWNRLKLPLAIIAATIAIAFVIWEVANPSNQPAAWDCTQHYDQCQDHGDYYLVQKDQLWGFADEKGNEFVAPRFQEVNPFDDIGLALVKEDGKYGWIDREGITRIAFEYDEAKGFVTGVAEVKKGGEVFYIDGFGGRLAEEKDTIVQAEPETPKEEPKKSTPPPAAKKEKPATFSPPEMVFVKGGAFMMGCTDEQGGDCGNGENPVHQVTVGDYKIGKYEVTQAQWRAVMGSVPPELNNKGCDQCPVERVSWNDIQEFLKKLNQRTGGNYRLPTEAEWEYAARGGQKSNKTKFAGSQNLDAVGWYSGNSGSKIHPVGKKAPNELGIYDMSGNVWEWCADGKRTYSSEAQTNPKGPSGGSRVLRGGSWSLNGLGVCRVSDRLSYNPDYRLDGLGFRLAQD